MFKKIQSLSMSRIEIAKKIHDLRGLDLNEEQFNKRYDELCKQYYEINKQLFEEIQKIKDNIKKYEDFFYIIDLWAKEDRSMEWYYLKDKIKEGIEAPEHIKNYIDNVIKQENEQENKVRKLLGMDNKGI